MFPTNSIIDLFLFDDVRTAFFPMDMRITPHVEIYFFDTFNPKYRPKDKFSKNEEKFNKELKFSLVLKRK